MFPWPFGRKHTPAAPNISSPILVSSSKPQLDRVTFHAFALGGEGATSYDLVNKDSTVTPYEGFKLSESRVSAFKTSLKQSGVEHLHFSWSSILKEISKNGTPFGRELPSSPYKQQVGDALTKQGFAADASPIFVSTEQYDRAAPFFGLMDLEWTTKDYPIVLGLTGYPITGVTGLTQVSSHAIVRDNIHVVYVPEAQTQDATMALKRCQDILVEAWTGRQSRVTREARAQAIRDVAEFM